MSPSTYNHWVPWSLKTPFTTPLPEVHIFCSQWAVSLFNVFESRARVQSARMVHLSIAHVGNTSNSMLVEG